METPILMSPPMVQAILDNRKTQTRRIIKIPDLIERPDRFRYKGNSNEFDIPRKAVPYDDRLYHSFELVNSNACAWVIHSHKSGDVLWVNEMYYAYGMWITNGRSKSGKQKWRFVDSFRVDYNYHYHENPPENVLPNTNRETFGWFKRSSLFMPKKACRIKLEITDLGAERVNDISEGDAIAEGIECYCEPQIGIGGGSLYNEGDYPTDHYKSLWESINGKGSWEKNPWVWVIAFKRIK